MMIFEGLPVSDIPRRLGCFIPHFLLFRTILPNVNILMAKITKSEEMICAVWHGNFGLRESSIWIQVLLYATCRGGATCWEMARVFSEPQFMENEGSTRTFPEILSRCMFLVFVKYLSTVRIPVALFLVSVSLKSGPSLVGILTLFILMARWTWKLRQRHNTQLHTRRWEAHSDPCQICGNWVQRSLADFRAGQDEKAEPASNVT